MDIYINNEQVESDKYIGGNLSAILQEINKSLNTMLNSVRERIDKGNSDELVTIISESFQPELDKLQAMADELTYHYDAEDVEPQVDDDLIEKEE